MVAWIFYNGQCSLCVQLARRFEGRFDCHAFAFAFRMRGIEHEWHEREKMILPETKAQQTTHETQIL